jgi:hypothetical protein
LGEGGAEEVLQYGGWDVFFLNGGKGFEPDAVGMVDVLL